MQCTDLSVNLCNSPWDLALMVKLIGEAKTGQAARDSPWPSTLNTSAHAFRHYTQKHIHPHNHEGTIKYKDKQRLFFFTETKAKQTKTGQMRQGRSCHLLPNSWDSIKSFYVLLMTNYISDEGSDWKTERKPQSPWLLLEWGELSGPVWGDGSPLHTCDRHWKSEHIFAVFA